MYRRALLITLGVISTGCLGTSSPQNNSPANQNTTTRSPETAKLTQTTAERASPSRTPIISYNESSNGCHPMSESVVRVKRVNLSSEQAASIDPIFFAELPSDEQEIVRTALQEEAYRKCPTADPYIPEALNSFAARAGEHANENLTAYLQYEGQYYELYVQIEDQIYSN